METCTSIGRITALAAVVAALFPCQPARCASPASSAAAITHANHIADVALLENGLLTGRIVDSASQAVAGANVQLLSNGQAIVSTQTDANGVFAVAGLRGGVHQVSTPQGTYACRLWAPGTAPPGAGQALEIGGESVIARGQWGPPSAANNFVRRAKVLATNPFVVGGVVAAAVAIPVAIHNADEDGRPSS